MLMTISQDPLANVPQKCAIRDEALASRYLSFDPVFQEIAKGMDQLFQEAVKWFIDITQRPAWSLWWSL